LRFCSRFQLVCCSVAFVTFIWGGLAGRPRCGAGSGAPCVRLCVECWACLWGMLPQHCLWALGPLRGMLLGAGRMRVCSANSGANGGGATFVGGTHTPGPRAVMGSTAVTVSPSSTKTSQSCRLTVGSQCPGTSASLSPRRTPRGLPCESSLPCSSPAHS